jgi:hypothetical protein
MRPIKRQQTLFPQMCSTCREVTTLIVVYTDAREVRYACESCQSQLKRRDRASERSPR